MKETAVRFFASQDSLRGGPADELCDEGYTAHFSGFPPLDLEGHKGFAATFYAAIPDLKHSIHETVVEADHVAVRLRLTGTNNGDFMGIPASGRPVDIGGMAMMTIAAGKVKELRGEFDQLGLMQQIGAIPVPT